jgi:CDP-glucose 4,6-dehydratase
MGWIGRTDLKPVIQNVASAEIREQYLDSSKARQLLGWQPRYAMEGAIEETVSWYREHLRGQLQTLVRL